MNRSFDVPQFYRSEFLRVVKEERKVADPKRKDLSPTIIDKPGIRIKLARHFGFCFGVENALDISYRTIRENPGKRIFLLSEVIHNPKVNKELRSLGVSFLMDTEGHRLFDFSQLRSDDVVLVPAFGTTVEIEVELRERGINIEKFDTTCPFVQKVWKRASELGKSGFTVIVHGKRTHEETRATFSHSMQATPTLVILDKIEAHSVADFIRETITEEDFNQRFVGCMSPGFIPSIHLQRIGIVNQTTMLASETVEISEIIRHAVLDRYGAERLSNHYADTRDTLCYATNENQTAMHALVDSGLDLALVIGGYKSSNTSHLVEVAEAAGVPCYFIEDAEKIISAEEIRHWDIHDKVEKLSLDWFPHSHSNEKITVGISAGASCPDQIIEQVVIKVSALYRRSDAGGQ
jgi:4-hydroxy-3-methylbut-2-enyl diphosphate reductase